MSLLWHKFSGCCDSSTFQTQVSTPSSFVIGESYYLETEIYSGCSYFISTGYTSGITVVSILNTPSSGYTTCSACTTVYTCLPLPSPSPTPTNTQTPSVTTTKTPTPTKTATPTRTTTQNATPTNTPSQTKTPFVTASNTQTPTITPTITKTKTPTNTSTPTNTPTNTQTPTNTPTNTQTPSNTPTQTQTRTPLPSFVTTSTPTVTPTLTLTPTPTTTQYTGCPQNSFCIFTNYSSTTQYNGVYEYYGDYNGKSFYYSPYSETNSFLFYKSGETRWCLSTFLGGDCIIFGPSPSNSDCPNLDNTFFNFVCPTPTPSNTDVCNTFDFTASFDCIITGVTPTPSITSTPTITPSQTITPTSYCLNKSVTVSATTFFYNFITPTPSTTPINTNQNCLLQDNVNFNLFKSEFNSTFNRLLINCANGDSYIVKETIPFNTGSTFNAVINGLGLCVTYISDIFSPPTASLSLIQSGNLFDCINCIPLPSATPTATVTKTPSQTPTISNTPSTTPCQNTGIDYTFTVGTGLNSLIDNQKIVPLSDGNYIIIGSFTQYNNTTCSGIVKIKSNGSSDLTFTTTSGFSSITISEFSPVNVLEQTDGKLICGGLFQFYSGVSTNGICRLNSDGTLDLSFSSGTGFSSGVLTLDIQSNNKTIVGGAFNSYNGTSLNGFCRLNSDGSLDTSFGSTSGFDGIVTQILVLDDDSMIVVGNFNYYNSIYLAPKIIKLSSEGVVDPTFNVGSGFNGTPNTLFKDSDNNIYVSGTFSEYSVYGPNYGFIKLNLSGAPDTTFQTNIGTSSSLGYISSISESIDDNLVITMFSGSSFNGVPNGSILKITKEGLINKQFYTLPGFNNQVVSTYVDSNNKVICLGSFNNFNGFNFNGIIRLLPCQLLYPTPTPTNTPTNTPSQTPTLVCAPSVSVSMTGTPYYINFNTNNGKSYVSQLFEGYDNIIEVINVSPYNLGSTINLNFGLKPTTFDAETNYLWVPNSEGPNTIIIDTITDNIVYVDTNLFDKSFSVGIDYFRERAYILSSEYSFLRVIDSHNFSYITAIGLSDAFEGNVIFDNYDNLMVVNGRNEGTITLVDCFTYSTTILVQDKYIPVGGLLFNKLDNYLYFINEFDNTVEVWNLTTLSQITVYDLSPYGPSPTNITFDDEKYYLYVGYAPSTVVTFDLSTQSYLRTEFYTEVGSLSYINYNFYDDKLYLLDQSTNTVKIVCTTQSPIIPDPTPTPTNTPTPTITPTNTITPFPSPTPTPTTSLTPTITPSSTTSPILPFVSIWTASSPISLPYSPTGVYTGTIDWGDGNYSANTYANRTHTYSSPGDYYVTVDGRIEGFNFGTYSSGYASSIKEIISFGSLKDEDDDYSFMFSGCTNLTLTGVTDTLDLTNVVSLRGLFKDCSSLSTINNIGSWDTSSVNNVSFLFNNTLFNSNINSWDVSNVIDMSYMFDGDSVFNQDISSWDVSNVLSMSHMFCQSLSFNQDISSWDVSNVLDISYMFENASSFNQNIGSWNISNVNTIEGIFQGATSFNQNISGWSTSNITDMSFMFYDASSFNQDISAWDLSNVISTEGMFYNAISFNQNINSWDTSNITEMSNMFNNSSSFNQTLSGWNISNVTSMSSMLDYTSINISNYSDIIINWASQAPSIQSNVFLGAINLVYDCGTAGASYSVLTGAPYNWIITDAGCIQPSPTPTPTVTSTPTITPTITPTNTETPTNTPTITQTPSITASQTQTSTPTNTPTNTNTPSITPTNTPSPSPWPSTAFISRWRTTTTNETVTLPYLVSGTYSGTIYWGDGSTSANTYGNRSKTYTNPGTYTIIIDGTVTGFQFNLSGDRTKIREILQWGNVRATSTTNTSMLYGCTNLVLTGVTDTPNLSGITSLQNMLRSCTSLTTVNNINSWNVSGVTNMAGMFYTAINFNDTISGWNVSNVTTFADMFRDAQDFNQPIGNWNTSSATNLSRMFYGQIYNTTFNQPLSGWNTSNVTSLQQMFASAINFNQPIGNWDTSSVTNMSSVFYVASSFNQPLSGWNTSNVTEMDYLFAQSSFNQNINNWDVSNVISLANTFSSTNFNQPLSGWNVSAATTMARMFSGSESFNQPIGNWDVSNVTSMDSMFFSLNNNHQFNQPLSGWNVSKVQSFYRVFRGCSGFDQNIGNWNTSAATTMYEMFRSTSFNNGGSPTISGWTTSSVTNMFGMFTNSSFNQPIGNWNVSNVTNMNGMFINTNFNQSISGWNVSNVTNMSSMFAGNISFNQNINNWNVSNVTTMLSMFEGSTSFNQPISGWNVSNVTNMTEMLDESNLSTINYDNLLISWSGLTLQNNVTFGVAGLTYTSGGSADSARSYIQSTYNWTFVGDSAI